MLNVMMGILAFFVMITMSLGNQALVDLQLPGKASENAPEVTPDPKNWFLVEVNAKGQFQKDKQPVSPEVLNQQVQMFLGQNKQGVVLLLPNRKLPYKQVIQAFTKLREAGGDRVSLVID